MGGVGAGVTVEVNAYYVAPPISDPQRTSHQTPLPPPPPHRHFFSTLWAEYRGVFAEEYMNLGGDEIDVGCWTNDTEVTAWLAARGTTDINVFIAYYYTTMMGVLKATGWKPMFWMVRARAGVGRDGVVVAVVGVGRFGVGVSEARGRGCVSVRHWAGGNMT